MPWYYYIADFFAGAFLANSVPHIVQGVCGNKFQSPFASPPGIGESSAVINVAWGWFNFAVGNVLLFYCFALPAQIGEWIAAAVGALVIGLWLAHHFGKVRSAAPRP
jgi:hypothetical protein